MATIQNIEWKKLIRDLSDHLTTEDVSELCFYLDIADGKKEKIKNGMELLNIVEDMGKISPDNPDLLKEMFEFIHRKNLVPKIDAFKKLKSKKNKGTENGSPRPLSNDLSGVEVQQLVKLHQRIKKTSSLPLLPPSHFQNTKAEESLEKKFEQDENDTLNGREQTPGTTGVYKMNDSKKNGCCLIINNMFEDSISLPSGHVLNKRSGSELDKEKLEKVFKWLNFEVQTIDNVEKERLKTTMEDFATNKCKTEDDCFVCCILSHGFEKGIYSNDGFKVSLSEVRSYFTGSQCPKLFGKPKLFFIQACQGEENGGGFPLIESDSPAIPKHIDNPRVVLEENISSDADFLFYMATTPGTVSWRDKENGTWFIQELTQVLIEHAGQTTPLYDMLLIMNDKVAKKTAYLKTGDLAKMMPDHGQNTLRKKLYFKPKMSYADYCMK